MGRKGFMMAELIVVSAIVLVTLVGLYTSYTKLFSAYKTRISYYDVTTLYRLGYYRDFLIQNGKLNGDELVGTSNIITIYDYRQKENKNWEAIITSSAEMETFGENNEDGIILGDIVYMIRIDKDNNDKAIPITSSIFGTRTVSATFKDYVDFLENSVDFSKFEYMMIMERCKIMSNKTVDKDDCTYAYLEIFE